MNFKKYGVGFNIEKKFKEIYGINERLRSSFLKNKIKRIFKWKNKNLLVERSLYEAAKNNITFYKTIKCYRGSRHKNKYPVRGQRTHTNAKKKLLSSKKFL